MCWCRYILYWGKLRHLELQDYCVVFNTSSEPGAPAATPSPANTYYLLCNKLQEDLKLRHSLMQMKLVNLSSLEKEQLCVLQFFTSSLLYAIEVLYFL